MITYLFSLYTWWLMTTVGHSAAVIVVGVGGGVVSTVVASGNPVCKKKRGRNKGFIRPVEKINFL